MLKYSVSEIISLLEDDIKETIARGDDHFMCTIHLSSSDDAWIISKHFKAMGYVVKLTKSGFFGTGISISGFNTKPTTDTLTEQSIRAKDAFSAWVAEPNPEQLKNGLSLKEMVAAVKPTLDLTAIMRSIQTAIGADKPNVLINLDHVSEPRRNRLMELGYTVTIDSNNSTVTISGW